MKSIIKIKILDRTWSVRFLPENLMREGDYGTCWSLKQSIDINDTLSYEETKIILGHELAHAYLAAFGKLHNKEFGEEEICDFVAWNIDGLMAQRDKILKERFGKNNE